MNKSTLILAILPAVAIAAGTSPDEAFYKKAAEGGMAEVELGKVAQEKGQSQAVKDFGAMMVKDHSAANGDLQGIAAGKGIDLPDHASMMQKAMKGKLEVMSGDAFDKAYVKGMVKDHKEDIKEFEKEAKEGKDADARKFANDTLPTLRKHLSTIERIASSTGVDTK